MISRRMEKQFAALLGPERYLSATEDRLTYAYDASGAMGLPDGVVFPKNTKEVSAIMAIASSGRLPVVPRGAGSGLTGGAVPPAAGGLVMVMSRLDRILAIDSGNLQAVVEPGVVTGDLQAAVEKKGLFYPPDPASMTFSSIGGNIAENAGGMRAVKYGVTQNFVMGLEVVLPGGDIIHTGSKCIKDVVGYDLTRLFVGSEGTLGVICRAILKLLPLPESRQTMTAGFKSPESAAKTVCALLTAGITPSTLEFMDRHCIGAVEAHLHLGLPTEAATLLLVEIDGKKSEMASDMARIRTICAAHGASNIRIAGDADSQSELWRARRAVHPALGQLRPRWEEEDIAVPIARLPEMIGALEAIGRAHHVLIVSFGHAGDGNIHVSVAEQDRSTKNGAIAAARQAILKTAVAMEGRIAAEHGIGLVKRDQIGWNIDRPTLELMRSIKRLLDPAGILNPGKIFPMP